MIPTAGLWDWRRTVTDLYTDIRRNPDPVAAWRQWRDTRDRLFAHHPQSPIPPEDRPAYPGIPLFDHNPALRFHVGLTPLPDMATQEFPAGNDGLLCMRPFARTQGLAASLGGELTLFWITGYGGGVFLPFADATSGRETYGAGRYLLDTIKGADLGPAPDDMIVLDFNFAYYPSCAYSDRYICPLAPPTNRLPAAVTAGECKMARTTHEPEIG